jgi:undecaprenyl-diphosphatase
VIDRTDERLLVRLSQRDASILHALIGRRRPALNRAMRHITRLGDPIAVIGFSLALWATGSAVTGRAGFVALVAMSLSHVLVQFLKRTISRPRPRLPVGVASLIQAPDRFSFPSGHAAAALSVALAVAPLLGLPLGGLAIGFGLLVGVSRCYLGVHYPGDVLAGWVLAGIGFAVAVTL